MVVTFVAYLYKMKRLHLVFLLFATCLGHAQNNSTLNDYEVTIDSLKNAISTSKSDSLRCIMNYRLAYIYTKNVDKKELGKIHLKKANELVKNNSYLKDLSYYYNSLFFSLTKENLQKFRKADEALKKYNSREIYILRSKILFNIGLLYQRENEPLQTIEVLVKEAIPVAKKSKDSQELSNLYKLIAVVFYNNEDIAKTKYYLDLSINTLEQGKSKKNRYNEDLIELYLFNVEVLSVQKKTNEAFEYLQKAEDLLKSYPLKSLYIEYYFAKGSLNQEIKNYEQAISDYDNGIKLSKLNKDSALEQRFKLMKYEVFILQNKIESAKDLLLDVFKTGGMNIKDRAYYSYELSKIYRKLNDFEKAYVYNEQYIQLKDSLSQMFEAEKIADIEAKYNKLENENKIKELTIEKQATLLNQRKNMLFLLLLSFALVCVLIFAYFIWKNLKNQKKITAQKEINHFQKLNNLKREKEIEIMQTMINVEEAERKRVARDLHDSIGSKLSALKIIFANTQNKNDYNDSRINTILETSIAELRQISYNLVPESLLKLGLEKALGDLCFTLRSDTVSIEFHSYEIDNSMPLTTQTNIFRIVQELLNNALKHSKATQILVSCSQNGNRFYISIEDNGVGFDISGIEENQGLGIKNIKSRIELLHGSLDCESSSGGTSYNIELDV
ncbi:tetratricopeptide repeat-containing sensor histidine kinase [Flavobacterium lindanitolerans]|uniref:histidine kinase n=1 Tax=Flavobacterium lindanitolerans TaxID=428988 RepID=A0A497U452_9FLAO|nr:sensor histidine kinase [Flavobacterium lindanitolerans]PKW20378.1 signal transduction histidine kinase [Flavobacterium lindanitolerans]RLJ23665.1 signal transduction histidine kinase [Flavobacterium lindanitolerans]